MPNSSNISETTASIAASAIDFASDGRWPEFRDHLLDEGWTQDEIVQAGREIGAAARRDPLFAASDFEDKGGGD